MICFNSLLCSSPQCELGRSVHRGGACEHPLRALKSLKWKYRQIFSSTLRGTSECNKLLKRKKKKKKVWQGTWFHLLNFEMWALQKWGYNRTKCLIGESGMPYIARESNVSLQDQIIFLLQKINICMNEQ